MNRYHLPSMLRIPALSAGLLLSAASLAAPVPANLGGGLKALVESHQRDADALAARLPEMDKIASDSRGRVRVDIYADGKLELAALSERVRGLDANVTVVYPGYRKGVITAYVPLARMASLASEKGVSSVILSMKPNTNVGSTTAQGAAVIKSDLVNADGITGAGITIGAMSDSFNVNRRAATRADDDVLSGDLPDLSNGNTRSPGVKFLLEGPTGSSDEGRAMLQIIHDVAPGADLCFATAYESQTDFANNIRELRTNPACNADVIVDDIIYFAEPMFSDGIVAQAVDEVVTSTTLAGKPVVYFSSAGNRGPGYTSKFRRVKTSDAINTIDPADPSIDLSQIPDSVDVGGGFQDFDSSGAVDISQQVTCSGADCTVVFQWNDPFDLPEGMTTDYNFLVFDANGNYLSDLSLTTDNFATSQPYEQSLNDLVTDTTYSIVIARTSAGTKEAGWLKYVFFGGSMLAEYNDSSGADASTYGHNSARNANGTAAYIYDDIPVDTPPYDGFSPSLESFSSPGPVRIFFDAAGNRLAEQEVRMKPDLAAPDGVNTTFFPTGQLSETDYEGDGFPNFFGTSAAAPHAAAVAGLMLEKAGGPGSLSADEVRTTLQGTAPERDIDPVFSRAVAPANGGQLSANGADPFDPNFFVLEVDGEGAELFSLTIDLTPTGLQFDPDAEAGFPLTVGSSTGPTITSTSPTAPTQVLELSFSGFTSGNSLSFGIDRDVAALAGYGNSADLLEGAIVTAVANIGTAQVTFKNKVGSGYIYEDGYGLIDALAATQALE